jgi:hypothetical protein
MTEPNAKPRRACSSFRLALGKLRADLLAKVAFVESRFPNDSGRVRPYLQALLSLERVRLDLDDVEAVHGAELAASRRKMKGAA